MTTSKKYSAVGLAGMLVLLAAASPGLGQEVDLTGRVTQMDRPGLSLEKRIEAAGLEFRKESREGLFLVGYMFPARESIHMGSRRDQATPYGVRVSENEIKIRRARRDREGDGSRYSVQTEVDGGGPTGLLLLFRTSGSRSRIVDAEVFDPERSYTFEDTPLYWLGPADAEESFALLRDTFDRNEGEIRNSLIFAISMHDDSGVTPFLKKAALADHPRKVRKNAIFWLGNLNTPESFRALQEIFAKVEGTELRKQVVFAYSLSDQEGVIQEMIRIAREDKDREVRKNAIFWLGNKASAEAADALQGVIEGSDEDVEIKKSAVFAISQLPKERSIPLLISIAKTNPSAALRKNAIFWLGQTGEEEALEFFEEILLKKH